MTSSTAIDAAFDTKAERFNALSSWLGSVLNISQVTLIPVAGDASFRRYFRINHGQQSFIVMDAPPERENVEGFVEVGKLFAQAGIRVPKVFECDLKRGFLLLEDFGDQAYFSVLNSNNADYFYHQAMSALEQIQCRIDASNTLLPAYDQALLKRELELFREWFLASWLALEIPGRLWQGLCQVLVQNAQEQPQVCVHRDFHSRNLMVLHDDTPGVLDFQDAVIGPITYDLVSLLKDCYIEWPQHRVDAWRESYRQQLLDQGRVIDACQWQFWFDRMGIQRHLKACGIFVRLWLRDQKPQYLQDIPRVLKMLLASCRRDPEFEDFTHFLSQEVMPAVNRRRLSP